MAAPRKYLDLDRTRVSDEWVTWNNERRFDENVRIRGALLRGVDADSTYYPEDHDKELGDGAWVFVIDPPNSSVALDYDVPLLSLWFARPHHLHSGRLGSRYPYQGIIQTPAGDLHLWPHEYRICSQPESLLGMEGVEIHSLGGDPVLDEEQLFYLTSRGIPRETATQLLFSQIKSQNYCYITLPNYAVEMFAGVGTSLRSHIARNPR